jgi:hypothetical protein
MTMAMEMIRKSICSARRRRSQRLDRGLNARHYLTALPQFSGCSPTRPMGLFDMTDSMSLPL